MKYNYQETREKGFSLVEIMVALGLVGGIALVVMNLGKQGSDIQRTSMVSQDEAEMLSHVRLLLANEKNCTSSLTLGPNPASPVPAVFKKRDADEPEKNEGIETAIYQRAHDGSVKRVLGAGTGSAGRYGKIKIFSVKLLFNNGTGFNYSQDDQHSDTAIIRLAYGKPAGGDKFTNKVEDIVIKVLMSTDASGTTTATSCSKESELFTKNTVAVTHVSTSGYVNAFDAVTNYTCPDNTVMCGEISYHNNGTEDRRHSFRCCALSVDGVKLNQRHCTWSGSVNDMDRLLNYTCPNDTIMAGHYSWHDNGTEDRVYDFYCCSYNTPSQNIKLAECEIVPDGSWANSWDQPVNFTCPSNKVKVGEVSIHSNSTEDRMYRFRCCKVIVEKIE